MSHIPGMMVLPAASMTVAPRGTGVDSAGPTATMRSSRTMTVVLGCTVPASLSNRSPCVMAMVPLVGLRSL